MAPALSIEHTIGASRFLSRWVWLSMRSKHGMFIFANSSTYLHILDEFEVCPLDLELKSEGRLLTYLQAEFNAMHSNPTS